MSEIERYVDKSMFPAAEMRSTSPQVHLLWVTPDPLGAVAAASRMYEGKPTYSLSEITKDERVHYWSEMKKTKLTAPLEFVKFHFFIEGVTREFTHQMVRQRTAAYAQESLRFAVKEDVAGAVRKPPALLDPGRSHSARNDLTDVWDGAVAAAERAYLNLIANGVPAEDARGLLPHAITTRLHYTTDLRNLLDHGGNRLCTQAQFEWKEFWQGPTGVINAIKNHDDGHDQMELDRWQFELIAEVFQPACYLAGKCPFKAEFDRGCTIRERVDLNHKHGIPAEWWGDDHYSGDGSDLIRGIDRAEWLSDPKAAWLK
jgi:flavin-dependent thymidylate synthase